MSHTIEWEGNSLRELYNLPKEVAQRIWTKIDNTKENPEHFLEKLEGMPEHKLRAGDYRVIILWDKLSKQLKIQAVGHRKNIYKKYKTD